MKQSDFDLSYSEWKNLIDEWILNEEERAMLYRRLLDHVTVEKIAEEFCFSVPHTSRKLNNAENRLFLHIK